MCIVQCVKCGLIIYEIAGEIMCIGAGNAITI